MILKPLENNYTMVTLGVTDIEQILFPSEFKCTEEQLFEAKTLGHACWSIIQHTAFSTEQWQEVNQMYVRMLTYLQNSKSKKTQTFYKNLVAWNIVTIWKRYQPMISTENPMYMRIECGKYLVFLKSWWCDMIGHANDGHKIIYDNKLYSEYFKDENGQFMWTKYTNNDKKQEITEKLYDWKIYTVEETLRSSLGQKLQRWMYPAMYGIEDYIYFQYNIVVKNEAAEKNLMPNVQEIRIKITKEEWDQLIKRTMVDVFKSHYDPEKNCLI